MPMTGKPAALRFLFVEDIPEDAEIAARELRKSGLEFESTRVDTREAFLEALESFQPSLVISDYSMPRFDGMKALQLSLERDPSLPFIVLTGSKNEETAVLCLKSGASDYVIKGHMGRLPFAAREALEHARIKRERNAAARELKESEQRFRTLADSGQALIWTSGTDSLCDYFNRVWYDFTGRSYEEERGLGWLEGVHQEDREACVRDYSSAFDRREKFSLEYRLRRRDGEYRWVIDDGSPRYGSDGEFLGYIGHCLDITERKVSESLVRKTLEDKEALLRELFHRTRNNMQVIMAILSFEEDLSKDERVSEVVRKTNDRIMSMALVHQRLYESQDLSMIDLKSYCEDLVAFLKSDEILLGERIAVKVSDVPVPVAIDMAVPCGLVLHELVSNALRHAFPGERLGRLEIDIARDAAGRIGISVSDDGVGLPPGCDVRRKDTLGFQLVHGLVEQQLKGRLDFERGNGLTCRIELPELTVAKRI